jgi:hypothetical protein
MVAVLSCGLMVDGWGVFGMKESPERIAQVMSGFSGMERKKVDEI